MQHVEDRARALRDAGVPGTWEELKVRATLDLLQERDSRPAPGEPPASGGEDAGGTGPDAGGPGPGGPGPGGPDPGAGGPSVGALITITVPATALGGDAGPAGEVAGFGILDHADTRDLVTAAAANPATRWCLTALHPDGTAAAHACAAGSRPWPPPGQGPPGQRPPGPSGHGPPGPSGQGPPGSTGPGPPGPITLRGLTDFLGITGLTPVIRGPCDHASAEDRYRPSREARPPGQGTQYHLLRARLRPPRRRLRPRPHRPPPPRRPDLRMQPGAAMPPSSPLQASRRLAARATRTRRPGLAHPRRTHLHHHPHPLRALGAYQQSARSRGRVAAARPAPPRRSRPAGYAPRPSARRAAGRTPRPAAAARTRPARGWPRRPPG